MTLAFVATGAAGLVIGICFRAPAILAATLVVVVASMAASGILGRSLPQMSLTAIFLVLTLQVAYLVGLALAVLWHRVLKH